MTSNRYDWRINPSNFYSANIPGVAMLSGAGSLHSTLLKRTRPDDDEDLQEIGLRKKHITEMQASLGGPILCQILTQNLWERLRTGLGRVEV